MPGIKQIVSVFFLLSCLLFPACLGKKTVKFIHYNGSYNRDFNDKNAVQLAVANKTGIQPLDKRENTEKQGCKLVFTSPLDNINHYERTN